MEPSRKNYVKPRVKSSSPFERIALACGGQVADLGLGPQLVGKPNPLVRCTDSGNS